MANKTVTLTVQEVNLIIKALNDAKNLTLTSNVADYALVGRIEAIKHKILHEEKTPYTP